MPGRDYVASIRDFWRVCSGVNEEAKARVVRFLNEVINTDKFPLTVLDRTDRVGNGQSRGKQLQGDDPRLPR